MKKKFRVWNNTSREFIDNEYLYIRLDGISVFISTVGEEITIVDDVLVEQYVGLEDKNEKEIYEGDILKYDYPTDEQVSLQNSKECQNIKLVSYEQNEYFSGWPLVIIGQGGPCEVIGNIHENPELLNLTYTQE